MSGPCIACLAQLHGKLRKLSASRCLLGVEDRLLGKLKHLPPLQILATPAMARLFFAMFEVSSRLLVVSRKEQLTADPDSSRASRKAWSRKGLTSPEPLAHASHSLACTCSQ